MGESVTSAASPTLEALSSFESLWRAWRRARRAKRGRGGEPAFSFALEENLLALSEALRARTWRPDPYRYFRLNNTKERVVSEATFRDRVVHHALVSALEPCFEPSFYEHSYACRKGKGTHASLKRVQRLAQGHSHALRLDVKKYFDQMDHEVLMGLLSARVKDDGVLWLCRTLLSHAQVPTTPCDAKRGVPIGNLTSQFWANVYLDPLDRLLSPEHPSLTRYMDDVVVFADDKRVLWELVMAAQEHLDTHLKLRLKARATQVVSVSAGVPWLGWRVFPALVRMDGAARRRFARKLRANVRRAASATTDRRDEERALVASGASLCGHVSAGSTLALRRRLLSAMS